MNTIEALEQENKRLKKRLDYLEAVLSEILMLNSLGKTLKINDAIHAAIDILE